MLIAMIVTLFLAPRILGASFRSSDCLEEGTHYVGGDIKEPAKKYRLKNIESATECQQKCQENPDCLFFTWNSGTAGGSWNTKMKNTCWLKKEKDEVLKDCGIRCAGRVSGPKDCFPSDPEWPTDAPPNNDAPTSQAPTTIAPTTVAQTTIAPTTEAPVEETTKSDSPSGGYSLITRHGYCTHVNGGWPTYCARSKQSQSDCQQFCTLQASCIGYFHKSYYTVQKCYLITSDSTCPANFVLTLRLAPHLRQLHTATTAKDLVAGFATHYVCYGKNLE